MIVLAVYNVALALLGGIVMAPPVFGYARRQGELKRAGWL